MRVSEPVILSREDWNSVTKENAELKKKCSAEQINNAYAETIERQAAEISKLKQSENKLGQKLDATKKQRDSLANFNPDWDMLEATQESLREHMVLCRELKERLKNCLNHDSLIATRSELDKKDKRITKLKGAFDEFDKLTYSFDSRKKMEAIRATAKGE